MRALLLSALLMLSACREGASPFAVGHPFEGIETGQLTFNPGNDHTPFWSQSGDSLYYGAPTYPGLPASRGMLLMVPRTGGTAAPLMPPVQIGLANTPWLAASAVSRDGGTIAFFEITDFRDNEFDYIDCPVPPLTPPRDSAGSGSMLMQVVLRVRPANSASTADAARLTIPIAGRTYQPLSNITNIAHPFHRFFEIDGTPFFRASWSPDGTRLVYSDGSNIRIWTVGQTTSTVVPGTEDGIMPAWSPDGAWLAFAKPFRGTPTSFTCFGRKRGARDPLAIISRTAYPYTRENSQLVVVRPTGADLRTLGEGDSPTWTSNSQTIVAHRAGNLFRIQLDNAAATQIAGTANAFEPMLSPDGRFVAFARRNEIGSEIYPKGNFDLWVAPF